MKILCALTAVAFAAANASAQVFADPATLERVDRSIERGLEYLVNCQNTDGSYPDNHGRTSAMPALCGMAFLSKGYVPGEGRYGKTINKCIDYIITNAVTRQWHSEQVARNPAGRYFPAGYLGRVGDGRMYAHSIATLFLSEVSGMVDSERQKRLDEILPLATKILLDAQSIDKPEENGRDQGGWRYQWDATDSDMSASGWALMALRSSRQNGAPVPARAIERAVEYIHRHHSKQWGSFGYQDGNNHNLTLTGAGILYLELCGRHNDKDALRGQQWIYREKRWKQLPGNGACFYGLYYMSQGLFQLGGDPWKEFSKWMYDTWIPRQEQNGSWNNNNEQQSRPYQTSLCILAMTVPYRQLPIYQRDETVDED